MTLSSFSGYFGERDESLPMREERSKGKKDEEDS